MQPLVRLAAAVAGLACVFVQPVLAHDSSHGRDGKEDDRVVTVAFGAGMNTAQPGNPANHHVLPPEIKVTAGDIVNFVVSGLHVIRVFDKGVEPRGCESADPGRVSDQPACEHALSHIVCFGDCAGPGASPRRDSGTAGNLAGSAALLQRVELAGAAGRAAVRPHLRGSESRRSGAVLDAGAVFVICAVLPHFNDGMTAWVVVDRARKGDDH